MLLEVPESVSYQELLDILQERIVDGSVPDDNEYFAELLFGLLRRVDMTRTLEEKRSTKLGESSKSVVIDITPYLNSKKNTVK